MGLVQGELFIGEQWRRVRRCDVRARRLADRHYSRQTPARRNSPPPGRVLVLLSLDERAVWAVCENIFRGVRRWRVTVFRYECTWPTGHVFIGREVCSHCGGPRPSALVEEATRRTRAFWLHRYHRFPCDLTTEIDPANVRRKRDPGRCFIRAGWRRAGRVKGQRHRKAIVLVAP